MIVLMKARQTRPQIILFGTNPRAATNTKFSDENLVKYLFYLEKSAQHTVRRQTRNSIEHYGMGYEDFLQAPLQVRGYAHRDLRKHDTDELSAL